MFACHAPQRLPAPDAATASHPAKPQIIFINFKAEQDDSAPHKMKVTWLNHIVVEGQLKQDVGSEKVDTSPEGLICSFWNANARLLKQIALENPLQRTVEYADEDGRLTTRQLQLREVEFSIRTQLAPGIAFVTVEQAADTALHLLLKQQLKQP